MMSEGLFQYVIKSSVNMFIHLLMFHNNYQDAIFVWKSDLVYINLI